MYIYIHIPRSGWFGAFRTQEAQTHDPPKDNEDHNETTQRLEGMGDTLAWLETERIQFQKASDTSYNIHCLTQ